MSVKLHAWEGILAVVLILAVIGGTLQLVASQLEQNPSLIAWMGSYQAPFLAFLSNSWIFIVVTFIYNIFMYLRQTQLANLQQTTEFFKIQKFAATLAWFVGILGPMAAIITDKETQGIITLVVLVATAFMKEVQNIQSNQTTLQPAAPTTPSSQAQPTTSQAPAPAASGTPPAPSGDQTLTISVIDAGSKQPIQNAYLEITCAHGRLTAYSGIDGSVSIFIGGLGGQVVPVLTWRLSASGYVAQSGKGTPPTTISLIKQS